MQNYASKVSEGMALQLGCLELRYVLLGAWGAGAGGGFQHPAWGAEPWGGAHGTGMYEDAQAFV